MDELEIPDSPIIRRSDRNRIPMKLYRIENSNKFTCAFLTRIIAKFFQKNSKEAKYIEKWKKDMDEEIKALEKY